MDEIENKEISQYECTQGKWVFPLKHLFIDLLEEIFRKVWNFQGTWKYKFEMYVHIYVIFVRWSLWVIDTTTNKIIYFQPGPPPYYQ